MTVTYVTGDKIQATYCNPITGKFECSPNTIYRSYFSCKIEEFLNIGRPKK